MSHLLSIQNISQALNAPSSASAEIIEGAEYLKKKYPYFLPTHYVLAAQQNNKEPYNRSMMAHMQLYRGNWYLFCTYLNSAVNNKPFEAVEVTEPVAQAEIRPEPVEVVQPVQPFYTENTYKEPEIEEEKADEKVISFDYTVEQINFNQDNITTDTGDRLILPIYTEDYFLHQGIHVSNDLPADIQENATTAKATEEDKSLMIMMSFTEWLLHFKTRTQKEKEERDDQRALKTMWQKEKLAAALEEENEEIPENVFEMAVNSIAKEEGLVSEALAEVFEKQGKYDKAIDMYKKLSLRNPQKNAYFARKIDHILKEKES